MSDPFHPLRVRETRPETPSATSVLFEVPAALADTFRWRPGQHLTLRITLDGEELRRSYSISESPVTGDRLRITVKRVARGRVSNHVNDHVKAGDLLEVMPPFGGFRLDPDPRARRTYYFFGAGSGITPLYAMLRSVLAAEPYSAACLAYGNTNAKEIVFRERLATMEAGSEGRLRVRHVLSSPSLFSSFDHWRRGRIDAAATGALLDAHPPYAQDTRYYICGPGDMNRTVRAALTALDVPPERIHRESYGGEVEQDMSFEGIAARARVLLDGRERSVPVAAGETLLDAVRAAGGTPPFSCESGVCGACRAWLRSGEVHLRARMALGDEEIAGGAILTCQAVAKTPEVVVAYPGSSASIRFSC